MGGGGGGRRGEGAFLAAKPIPNPSQKKKKKMENHGGVYPCAHFAELLTCSDALLLMDLAMCPS